MTVNIPPVKPLLSQRTLVPTARRLMSVGRATQDEESWLLISVRILYKVHLRFRPILNRTGTVNPAVHLDKVQRMYVLRMKIVDPFSSMDFLYGF